MSWREKLRPASFRGIPFKVDSSNSDYGRRNVSHEYPKRDIPYGEDLGRKQREFSLEAYVLGDDYLDQCDQLIEACEAEGRGELVHPYRGTQWVICTGCKVKDAINENGLARLTLSFSEAGEQKFPSVSADNLGRLGIAGEGVFSSIRSSFSKVYSTAKMPQKYFNKATDQIKAVSDTLGELKGIGTTASSYAFTISKLSSEAMSLATSPSDLASRITGAISLISNLKFNYGAIASAYGASESSVALSDTPSLPDSDPEGVLDASSKLLNIGGEDVFQSLPYNKGIIALREKENENTKALLELVKCSALVVAAKAAAEIDYATYEDAIERRTALLDFLDVRMINATDDQVYQSLQELKVSLIQSIPEADKDLPNLVTIENKQTRPSLVIAYMLYASLNKEVDIISRNKIEHPGFIPGGTDLEVISA